MAGTMHNVMAWDRESWRGMPNPQAIRYEDEGELRRIFATLSELPPLVTSWEIDRLKVLLAEAQQGRRFVVQGGDCAETFADCRSPVIASQMKILLQMSLVLVHAGHLPIVRVGRFAGQYIKPRSRPVEVRDGVELPSYFGDMVNRTDFSPQARRPKPENLLTAYTHAALTLNFVRSLSFGGFADLHHPEYWDLAFLQGPHCEAAARVEYLAAARQLATAFGFVEAVGEGTFDALRRVEFFTSHEGLHLDYEAAQTRRVPRHADHYDLTTHFPWIGERTRALDGAHVEFFRGVANPIGVKLGPKARGDDVVALAAALNPRHEDGKLAFITRMGAAQVSDVLPALIHAVKKAGHSVLWMCDPMHGNTRTTPSGVKTRSFDDVTLEVLATFAVHAACDSTLGGVHFELTGANVTECIGGASGITEADLGQNYATVCDPRLNYGQALEMSFLVGRELAERRRASRDHADTIRGGVNRRRSEAHRAPPSGRSLPV